MASTSSQDDIHGLFRYMSPDNQLPASSRCLYLFPAAKVVKNVSHKLHDIRSSPDIVQGPQGLDVQGFMYMKHESALSGDQFYEGRNVEDVYFPELIELICKITGASRAIVDDVAIRRRVADEAEFDPYQVWKRGCELDKMLEGLPRDVARVTGKDVEQSKGPARQMHVDYSEKGLRDAVRYTRQDIVDVARPWLEAEDRGERPRYAVYSIWRAIRPVKRDPIAVLDWRSVDPSEVVPSESRALSAITPSGETLRSYLWHTPPKNPDKLRWYWLPDQQPDEVLIFKFADTGATEGSGIAAHCVHGSCELPGTEREPARESVDSRVIAFFD